jgi:hypothetical protein
LDVVQHDLELAALLAGGLVLPLVELQAALDEERAALGAVLGDDLALLSPGLDVDERRLLAGLAALVLPLSG